jgi:AcrR family transcriptional regulator
MKDRKKGHAAKHSRTQAQRSEATRQIFIDTATQLFAAQGFAATSLDEILQIAGMTRGALYHHFENKKALFQAVFEQQEQVLTNAVAAAAQQQSDTWLAFRAGCTAFLTACLEPGVQQIILIDAPAVLGWEVMREIESRYALTLLRGGLQRAINDGKLRPRSVEPLAHFLLGGLSECAMAIARATDPIATMQEANNELDRLLTAIANS